MTTLSEKARALLEADGKATRNHAIPTDADEHFKSLAMDDAPDIARAYIELLALAQDATKLRPIDLPNGRTLKIVMGEMLAAKDVLRAWLERHESEGDRR